MQRLAWVFAGFLILAFQLPATPCIAGATLASYQALGATGCTIGPQTVSNFAFSNSVSGGGTAASNTDILVTPTFGATFYGVQFAATDFTTATGIVNYVIGFTWDSIPIVGMGDALDPGNVDILTDGCAGAAFVGSSCSGTLVSVHVFPTQLTDSAFFSPIVTLGISNAITLTGPGSFNSIENDAFVVPEPASFLLAVLGAAIIAARRNHCNRRLTSASNLVRNTDGAPAGNIASALLSTSIAPRLSPFRS
jgi:hypothetical protein